MGLILDAWCWLAALALVAAHSDALFLRSGVRKCHNGARLRPDIRCERSNRAFSMGRIVTKAQFVGVSWVRGSTLFVDGEAPFSLFLPARPSSSAIGPHCAIFWQAHMSFDSHAS